jgi:hypothetical protein
LAQLSNAFDISLPASQVALEEACNEVVRRRLELGVRRQMCFMNDFRAYLLKKNSTFVYPATNAAISDQVHYWIYAFVSEKKYSSQYASTFGFDDYGRVTWLQLTFMTNLPREMPSDEVPPWQSRWGAFVEGNTKMVEGGVYHTSWLWVRADFETRVVQSVIWSAGASVALTFLAVTAFLRSGALALLLMVAILSSIACLAGVMFGVLNWSLGTIEAVTLIVVVGLSVDYALHLAEAYHVSVEATRYARVQDAFRRTGSALVAAAFTTILACPPLLFCLISVFVQFGAVIIMNMFLALVFGICFLGALLMVAGPMNDRAAKQADGASSVESVPTAVGTVVWSSAGLQAHSLMGTPMPRVMNKDDQVDTKTPGVDPQVVGKVA